MATIRAWWGQHFLNAELIAAAVLTAVFAVWSIFWGGTHPIDALLKDNRSAVYGALASVAGSLLGFTITAASIIVGYSTNEKMAIIRESRQYQTLWHVFTAAIRALAFATIMALLGLIADRDISPNGIILCLTAGSVILAVFRLGRCLWAFENIVGIISKPTPSL